MSNINEEAFKLSKGKTQNNKNIAFLDPNIPENKDTFKHKDIFKKYGANWDRINKFWFWYIGDTKEQWEKVTEKFIKPALFAAHKAQNATNDESETSIIASIDAIMGDVKKSPTSINNPNLPTEDEKKNVLDRLQKFKEMIVNLDSDEEFKKTMLTIRQFRSVQGHKHSLNNSFLIWIQNPEARMVKSKYYWNKINRDIKEDANKILIFSPNPMSLKKYSDSEKETITSNFLNKIKKKSVNDLTLGEKEKLSVLLRGKFQRTGSQKDFILSGAYDIKDTHQIDGKEELVDPNVMDNMDNIKWYEEDMIDEKVKPIYEALIAFAETNGIKIDIADDLGGARGSSSGGKINLLKNNGDDVGLTKTLAHELSHEMLHQNYLKSRDSEFEKYFVGRAEGTALVEQQAELTAWIVLAEFGFNLKTTSINYVAVWGADKEKMVKVFDMISNVANYLISYIDKFIANRKQSVSEENIEESQSHGKITPLDVAKFIGVQDEYVEELNRQKSVKKLQESFKRYLG